MPIQTAIRHADFVASIAFEDLGMEAIHEFTVEDMPVTVAVDSLGTSVHGTGAGGMEVADRRHPGRRRLSPA